MPSPRDDTLPVSCSTVYCPWSHSAGTSCCCDSHSWCRCLCRSSRCDRDTGTCQRNVTRLTRDICDTRSLNCCLYLTCFIRKMSITQAYSSYACRYPYRRSRATIVYSTCIRPIERTRCKKKLRFTNLGARNEEPCKIRHQSAALNTSVHNNLR